jgi:hypothetical protein
MRRIRSDCCARAAGGQATAATPMRVMNSRRLICLGRPMIMTNYSRSEQCIAAKVDPLTSELVKLRPQEQSPHKTIAALIRSAWSSTSHSLCIRVRFAQEWLRIRESFNDVTTPIHSGDPTC